MGAALLQLRADFEARFDLPLEIRKRPQAEHIQTGIEAIDWLTSGGIPRGTLTEICGTESSGRTALMFALLRQTTSRGDCCAWIDASGTFDPTSAAEVGVDLEHVLWVNCGGNAEHALKSTDLLIQAGGFVVVVLDLGDTPEKEARRIPLASWYRLRYAAERTGVALVAVERRINARSCSELQIEMQAPAAGMDRQAVARARGTGEEPKASPVADSGVYGGEVMYACLHAPGNLSLLIECARGFSPRIEKNPPDTVVFDARGLEALHGPPASLAREIERRIGVPANIAIASNPDAAVHAGRGFRGITVIEPGKEATALAPLPLNLLGGSAETAELLHLWGVRTFGDFAKLPPLGVAARLGDEGIELQRLARGDGYRQIRAARRSAGIRRRDRARIPCGVA